MDNMKYLKKFEKVSQYDAFKNGSEWVTPNVSYVAETSKCNFQVYVKPPTPPYLIIEALEDGLTVSVSDMRCEYCVNGDYNWKTLVPNEETASIASGQTLYFKRVQAKGQGGGTFTISKKCNLNGNCMSMVFGDEAKGKTDLSEYPICFSGLFSNCTTIVSVNDDFLPATTLSPRCYGNMFHNCKNLIKAPKLPATILTEGCYNEMFDACSSLTTAPELPATIMVENCYNAMFRACSSLATAPKLLSTTLSDYCYYMMFFGCHSLTTAPELPATTLTPFCYNEMFDACSSLTTTPELPATTLAESCYGSMFAGTPLTTAPELPATTLAPNCYGGMFAGCRSLTTAPELPATILTEGCYNVMFNGCRSLITAPELPATTLTPYCYAMMFKGCSNLNYIKMLATDITASMSLTKWVDGVSSTGTFVKNTNMDTLPSGVNGIPEGWTVVSDGKESGGNLIKFTIDGVEYQAEEGMTWGEWVDSEYNVIGASIYLLSNGVGHIQLGVVQGVPTILYTRYGNYVIATQEIITNHSYIIESLGGGI